MKNIIFATLIFISFLAACNQASQADYAVESAAISEMPDSTQLALISSSAAVVNGKDSTRKFIRTASMKFKVKSVLQTTYFIEDIAKQYGGFVTATNLSSDISGVYSTPISADSSLESTNYVTTNNITLRIPNTKLDTTLKELSKNIEFLDYRTINADDVALQLLSNTLTQKRAAKTEARLKSAIENGKTDASDIQSRQDERADNANVANLSLQDQINFSTVNLVIYERPTVKRDIIPNNKNIDAYQPSFGHKIMEAFKNGWGVLMSFILFLVNCWGIFLFIGGVYFLYKRYGYLLKK